MAALKATGGPGQLLLAAAAARSPHDEWSQRADVDVAEGDGAVIALDHQGILHSLRKLEVGAGRAVDVDLLLNQLSVEQDAQEPGGRRLLPRGVEPRRAEPGLIGLPFARPP